MIFFEMNVQSQELKHEVQINVLLPDRKTEDAPPCKTLWLLHGLMGNHTSWMRKTAIDRYATEHNIAVVMPDVGRSWYTDTVYEANYFSFIAHELPEMFNRQFKGLSRAREFNMVGGLSMGGYGALKLALSHPEQYDTCISLSGSLDITRKGRETNLAEWRSIFDYHMETPLSLEGSKHDLFALAAKNKEAGLPFPKLYMWCGESDSLLPINRAFSAHLTNLNIPHIYEESEGDHSWKWWDIHMQDALRQTLK